MVLIPEMEHANIGGHNIPNFLHSQEPIEPLQQEGKHRKAIEYWSKTYNMWIPAEITAVDHDRCAVQVNVKPGVWLTSKDWDKKLRVAVYACAAKDDIDYCIGTPDLNKVIPSGIDQTLGYNQQDVRRHEQAAVNTQLHPLASALVPSSGGFQDASPKHAVRRQEDAVFHSGVSALVPPSRGFQDASPNHAARHQEDAMFFFGHFG